ncbi:hypothetical protein [Paenibacillus eucommiae]|uniref:Uncharacterized protein n=1 Tax=Paenibacillus eucommiae TaxID=1355755 RepID=A0ABS4IT78_9BACL|nr:hypothetical protein [Paenibacillus eucommiae]MBP1990340.1 hypothetical protein [Paenibacillus eucommiae]
MRIHLKFTTKGKIAIENFENAELIEIFTRYSHTLTKKHLVDIYVPVEANQNIVADGMLIVLIENVKCDVDTLFKELGRDIKVPLKKRLDGKLDTVFKTEIVAEKA